MAKAPSLAEIKEERSRIEKELGPALYAEAHQLGLTGRAAESAVQIAISKRIGIWFQEQRKCKRHD